MQSSCDCLTKCSADPMGSSFAPWLDHGGERSLSQVVIHAAKVIWQVSGWQLDFANYSAPVLQRRKKRETDLCSAIDSKASTSLSQQDSGTMVVCSLEIGFPRFTRLSKFWSWYCCKPSCIEHPCHRTGVLVVHMLYLKSQAKWIYTRG